jgi:hypothetical protein
MKRLLLISLSMLLALPVCGAQNSAALATTNSSRVPAATKPSDQIAAPGTSENRSLALSLLKKHADTMARLHSYMWTEEISAERNARYTDSPLADLTGKSREMKRNEFRTDGNRYSIRLRRWGNAQSATVFVPEECSGFNRFLWDGKRSIGYTASMGNTASIGTLGRVSIFTHRNEIEGWPKTLTPEVWWTFWSCGLAEIPAKATSLTVRTNLEQVGQAKCYVVEVVTPVTENSVTPPARFTVYDTVWLDPERGHNIVHATQLIKCERGSTSRWSSTSTSLERVTCKEIEGIWIPMEGQVSRYELYSHNDYERLTSHVQITRIVLNPDHQALRSFVPDDIKNGALVLIDPVAHQRFNVRQLPTWQNGRVVDKQGRVLFDSGLTKTNSRPSTPAGKS